MSAGQVGCWLGGCAVALPPEVHSGARVGRLGEREGCRLVACEAGA